VNFKKGVEVYKNEAKKWVELSKTSGELILKEFNSLDYVEKIEDLGLLREFFESLSIL
jgi:hypothetical protein